MYGVITTVPAPVEMYDGMHAEMMKTGRHGHVDGLPGARRAGNSRRVRGAGSVGVQGAL